MTIAPAKRYTPAELLSLPDNGGIELVDGQLVEKPVSKESSRIAARIIWLLMAEAAKTDEAEVYSTDLGYQCFFNSEDPDEIRKPDASLIRKERLAPLTDDVGYMPIPADLAVEVLSPNDNAREIGRKVELYLAAGFKLVWVVDPDIRLVTVHRADGTVQKFHESDEITGEIALPGFRSQVLDLLGVAKTA